MDSIYINGITLRDVLCVVSPQRCPRSCAVSILIAPQCSPVSVSKYGHVSVLLWVDIRVVSSLKLLPRRMWYRFRHMAHTVYKNTLPLGVYLGAEFLGPRCENVQPYQPLPVFQSGFTNFHVLCVAASCLFILLSCWQGLELCCWGFTGDSLMAAEGEHLFPRLSATWISSCLFFPLGDLFLTDFVGGFCLRGIVSFCF